MLKTHPISRLAMTVAAVSILAACPEAPPPTVDDVEVSAGDRIEDRLEQFEPTELRVDLSVLSESEREVLAHLVAAARQMDEIFLRQVSTGNEALLAELEGGDPATLELFRVHFGPWDRLDEMASFVGDVPHPSGAGYYPADISAAEFEAWIEANPDDEAAFKSLTTVIRRRDPDLIAIPYSIEYQPWLAVAADHMKDAAAATDNESLRRFLESRAAAFATDDYYESDKDWMDLDAPVEVTIGPYETYEDSLFGYKAAFEAFVTVNLPEQSEALARYKALLPSLERNLPIPDEHKNFDRGSESPIRVVDVLFTGGDTKAGVQTLAFNLPNDERVREEKGSKKVLLRNVMRAKYDSILTPIAERVLAPENRDRISFDAYFNQVLQHELAHGLGPGNITVDGRETEVRLELKEIYSTLEEAKADVMGIYSILHLVEEGEMDAEILETLEPTYVAGLFRSARFGLHEAHGRGVVSQFNYLLEKGALEVTEEGHFRTVSEVFPGAIEELLNEMLMLQARGDYDGTSAFLNRYGVATPALEGAIDKLHDVPVDIRPIYTDANSLSVPLPQ